MTTVRETQHAAGPTNARDDVLNQAEDICPCLNPLPSAHGDLSFCAPNLPKTQGET
jgi:hypothetical protein